VKEKTAFTCRMMNEILHDYIDCCTMVYLDDIIIFSWTEEDHVRDVMKVVLKLDKHKLIYNGHCAGIYLRRPAPYINCLRGVHIEGHSSSGLQCLGTLVPWIYSCMTAIARLCLLSPGSGEDLRQRQYGPGTVWNHSPSLRTTFVMS